MATITESMAQSAPKRMFPLLVQRFEVARMFDVLSNPNRLQILAMIAEREVIVGDISHAIGLSQSAVSQHLSKMRDCGIVSTRREAQRVFYRLASDNLKRFLYEMNVADITPQPESTN